MHELGPAFESIIDEIPPNAGRPPRGFLDACSGWPKTLLTRSAGGARILHLGWAHMRRPRPVCLSLLFASMPRGCGSCAAVVTVVSGASTALVSACFRCSKC